MCGVWKGEGGFGDSALDDVLMMDGGGCGGGEFWP